MGKSIKSMGISLQRNSREDFLLFNIKYTFPLIIRADGLANKLMTFDSLNVVSKMIFLNFLSKYSILVFIIRQV